MFYQYSYYHSLPVPVTVKLASLINLPIKSHYATFTFTFRFPQLSIFLSLFHTSSPTHPTLPPVASLLRPNTPPSPSLYQIVLILSATPPNSTTYVYERPTLSAVTHSHRPSIAHPSPPHTYCHFITLLLTTSSRSTLSLSLCSTNRRHYPRCQKIPSFLLLPFSSTLISSPCPSLLLSFHH